MALFSKSVAVNIDEVIKFRESTAFFSQATYNIANDMMNNIEEMVDVANQRANELEKIASSYDSLYSSVKQLERDVVQHISTLKTQLNNTPKELEEKYTDKEGNEKVKKIPNPEYKALEEKIRKENSRLSAVKELSWKVYNEVSYSRRVASELASYAQELKNIIPELHTHTRDIVTKSESALRSLESSIRAINNYMTFNFSI